MQETFSPRDLKQSQINVVKQPDQAASKHGMNNLNTQENKLSANQNLDNSKDNNKKDDKQPQNGPARLSETEVTPGCGGIIGNISNTQGDLPLVVKEWLVQEDCLSGLPIVIKLMDWQ